MPPKIDWSKLDFQPDYDSQEWWDATKESRLLVRVCHGCGHKWWPPSIIGCANCGETEETGWVESKGGGVVHSFIVVVQPIMAAFMEAVPYIPAIIALDDVQNIDGNPVRLQGILDEGEEQVGINARVEMYFERISEDGKQVPRWRLADQQPD
ncbi:MAG: OB-fold domain-containing protein, partial [Dehalococcoidia bacterium]